MVNCLDYLVNLVYYCTVKTQKMANSDNKTNVRTIVIRIILVLALGAGAFFGVKKIIYELHHESTDNAQVEARLVPVLPRVAGYIKALYVEDYSTVKKDSLLAEIDDSELALQLEEMEADLNQAKTDIENARASLANARVSVGSAKANLTVAETRKAKASADLQRDQALYTDAAITKKQFDDSKANADILAQQYEVTKNEVTVAESKLAVLEAQLKKAEAQIAVKQARIDQQKLKLSYCKIYATSDGKIGRRNIDAGQFVQAGAPLFTIVNDQDFWIVANFKETQIKHMKIGDEVHVKFDAYPDMDVTGRIESFSDATGAKFSLLPPDNATGNFVKVTQRIPVKVVFADEAKIKDKLRAGMSVEVSVAY